MPDRPDQPWAAASDQELEEPCLDRPLNDPYDILLEAARREVLGQPAQDTDADSAPASGEQS